jgi:hypothetical protein
MQANFKDFTFVHESSMEANMGGRAREDYEDMDYDKREHDWHDPIDVSNKTRGDRMSGIVRTGTDGDGSMFNGGHFDM